MLEACARTTTIRSFCCIWWGKDGFELQSSPEQSSPGNRKSVIHAYAHATTVTSTTSTVGMTTRFAFASHLALALALRS
jgi:hypothetical protein